jgi:integrase
MSTRKRHNKWWVDFSHNGHRFRFPSPDNSLAGSRAYEALLRQKLAKGESLMTNPDPKINPTYNFKDFVEKWFEVYVKNNNKPSEIKRKKCTLRKHLLPHFGEYQLDKIKSLDIEEFKTEQIKKGFSAKSINNHLGILGKCLRTAIDWEIIETVPRLKLLKVQPQKFDYLSEVEAERLLLTATGIWHDLILTALYTGLRFSELTALSWEDVNFKEKVLTVKNSFSNGILGSTKSNKIRYIPLTDELCKLFKQFQKDKGFIFVNSEGKNLKTNSCLRNLYWICDKAGLRHIGWHTLRHTFASRLAEKGISIMAIKELLGHSEICATMRYAHLGPLVLREAIDIFSNQQIQISVTKTSQSTISEKILTPNLSLKKLILCP